MLRRAATYDELVSGFGWTIPERYNIGVDVCDKWAATKPRADALLFHDAQGGRARLSFGQLRALSNQLANALRAVGVAQGDRVGILLPQAPETAYAHIAVYKLGAIALPLFTLFGPDALEYRLHDAGVATLVTNGEGLAKVEALRHRLPQLKTIFSIDRDAPPEMSLHAAMARCSDVFEPVDTAAEDPALIIYTSGTTGKPKGALHAHRVLLGHLPGVEMSHDFFPQAGDLIWTPADWAWIGGLLDVLLPALHHGVPVVAHRFARFTGEAAFATMHEFGVRNVFLPPTALKFMRAASGRDKSLKLSLRSVASGGEPLGAELLNWGREMLGVTINEFYGQTECNMVVSSCAGLDPARPGRMGRPVPGHAVEIVDAEGWAQPPGVAGEIAVRRGDPVMFLGYWNNPQATRDKFRGDWLLTGDMGLKDESGWLKFEGRADDIITSAGYRIGPGEIEDCLITHPAVQMAGVIGKPDAERTEIVKAYVVLKPGFAAAEALAQDIRRFVRDRLAAHEYPREIAFVAELPMTVTGKVIRRELRARAIAESGDAN
ncbi:MAG: acyl-CoA synthetase [Pseudomonadota bacterium]|nr:acyl-CoA synthetase [Pseudomonadota bacterium]